MRAVCAELVDRFGRHADVARAGADVGCGGAFLDALQGGAERERVIVRLGGGDEFLGKRHLLGLGDGRDIDGRQDVGGVGARLAQRRGDGLQGLRRRRRHVLRGGRRGALVEGFDDGHGVEFATGELGRGLAAHHVEAAQSGLRGVVARVGVAESRANQGGQDVFVHFAIRSRWGSGRVSSRGGGDGRKGLRKRARFVFGLRRRIGQRPDAELGQHFVKRGDPIDHAQGQRLVG